jgi:hypothetical protein
LTSSESTGNISLGNITVTKTKRNITATKIIRGLKEPCCFTRKMLAVGGTPLAVYKNNTQNVIGGPKGPPPTNVVVNADGVKWQVIYRF